MDILKLQLEHTKNLIADGIKRPRNVIITVGGFGASYFVYLTVKLYRKKRRYRHIPGPPTHGILGFFKGNASDVKKALKNEKVLPELLAEWQKTYGDVFKFQMFNKIIVVTTSREAIKEVLVEKNLPKSLGQQNRSGFPMGERFLGTGLLTDLDHERWKQRRAVFNPGFHRNILMTFISHFNEITNSLTQKFRVMADGKTVVHLFNEINRATLDAIALIAFGMNVDAVNQKESTINSYLTKSLQVLMKSAFDPFMRFRPLKQSEVNEFRKIARFLRQVGKNKIEERIETFANEQQNNSYDILSSILSSFKGEEIDLEGMTDDFLTFFVAGQETTANALAFCFLEMGKNPEIARKAREEVDQVLGEREEVNYQDVNDLKYCSAIFKEALRLYPPAPVISRQVVEKMDINGYEIPDDTQLLLPTFVTCRDERYFKEPLVFNPDRFVKNSESDAKMENYVYFPFSLGPRNCIGQNFAQIEGVIVIAKMVQKFDLKLDPTQSFALDQAITLRPRGGTRCYLTMRS